ncbi:MAG TPA: NADH-quinone oxidoreductase subunit NuoE [Bacteroidota bacterium]|nr:NADH-quinone oxidoreductase subunit NuoE [Bacteroidota bacterium]
MFSPENLKKLEQLKKQFPTSKALTLPVLWLAQNQYGWISPETMKEVAEILQLPLGHVYGVVTFYTMFNPKPVGKYHLQVCTNISCGLLGAEEICDHICHRLNIQPGGTTADRKFTVTEVECLGSCGTAPVIQVNDDYVGGLTIEKADQLMTDLK